MTISARRIDLRRSRQLDARLILGCCINAAGLAILVANSFQV